MKRERGTSWPDWQELVLRHDHDDLRATAKKAKITDSFYQLQPYQFIPGLECDDVTPLGLAILHCCSPCIYAFADTGVDFNRICYKDEEETHTPMSLSLRYATYTTRAVLRGGVDHLAYYEEHIKRTLTGTDIPLIVERYRALRALMWTAQNLPDRIWRDIAEPMLKALDTAMRWKDMN